LRQIVDCDGQVGRKLAILSASKKEDPRDESTVERPRCKGFGLPVCRRCHSPDRLILNKLLQVSIPQIIRDLHFAFGALSSGPPYDETPTNWNCPASG
jgi:hypothetical protein